MDPGLRRRIGAARGRCGAGIAVDRGRDAVRRGTPATCALAQRSGQPAGLGGASPQHPHISSWDDPTVADDDPTAATPAAAEADDLVTDTDDLVTDTDDPVTDTDDLVTDTDDLVTDTDDADGSHRVKWAS